MSLLWLVGPTAHSDKRSPYQKVADSTGALVFELKISPSPPSWLSELGFGPPCEILLYLECDTWISLVLGANPIYLKIDCAERVVGDVSTSKMGEGRS